MHQYKLKKLTQKEKNFYLWNLNQRSWNDIEMVSRILFIDEKPNQTEIDIFIKEAISWTFKKRN